MGLVTGQAGFAAGETEVKADARRGVPFRLRNRIFNSTSNFEFAVKAKAAESLVPSNDFSSLFSFAAFSMQHRQTAFLSKRLFYLCRQEQSKVEQHDRCCDCSHDQQKHLLHKHILSRRFYLLMNLISYSSKLYTLPKKSSQNRFSIASRIVQQAVCNCIRFRILNQIFSASLFSSILICLKSAFVFMVQFKRIPFQLTAQYFSPPVISL